MVLSTPPANIPVAGNLHGEAGIQTAALGFGGYTPGVTDATIEYDGTAWATTASLPAALNLNGTSQGTTNTNSGFTVGGSSGGSISTNTTEFTAETTALNVKTLTQS